VRRRLTVAIAEASRDALAAGAKMANSNSCAYDTVVPYTRTFCPG
jgi:hypothetical protein